MFIETINNLVQKIGELKEEIEIYSLGKELRSALKSLRKRTSAFQEELKAWAAKRAANSEAGISNPLYTIIFLHLC